MFSSSALSGLGDVGYSTSGGHPINATLSSDEDDAAPPQLAGSHDSASTTNDSCSATDLAPVAKQARLLVDLSCQKYYEQSGNSKKLLLSMCVGLNRDNPSFCIFEEDKTYKNAKNSRSFKPTNKDLAIEVSRRYKSDCGKEKRCASWSGPKLKEWLLNNPITDDADILFLKREESHFRLTLERAEVERLAQDELHSDNGPSWIGIFPWLRMYHAVIEDDVLPSYLKIQDWSDRSEIDARNTNTRPKSFYELCANKFNDPSFTPETNIYADLHEDFSESTVLLHTPNTLVATPDKIKDKLSSARFLALRVIKDWEKSGNGSGQRAEDSTELGHIVDAQQWSNPDPYAEEEFIDGDNRKNFLRGSPSHVLYLWQLFDVHDILHHTLAVLLSSLGASSEGVSASLTDETGSAATQRCRAQAIQQEAESRFWSEVGLALASLARSNDRLTRNNHNVYRNRTYKQLRTARQNKRIILRELLGCDNAEERAVLEEEREGLISEILALESALRVEISAMEEE